VNELEEYRELIDRLFCRPGAEYGGYALMGDPVMVVPGRVVRAPLSRRTELDDRYERYQLTLFTQISGVAGELWEHSARNMIRLGATNHPALPQIAMAKFVPAEEVAVTLTRQPGQPIDIDVAIAWARRQPLMAVEHFSILLDALNELHAAGIIHRNLTAAALDVRSARGDDDSDEVVITLSRFEMSTLISNIIRMAGASEAGVSAGEMRRFYTAVPPGIEEARYLCYIAPELHGYLLDENTAVRRDWVSTDVFGLATASWEWFCGPVPEVLPEPYAALRSARGPERQPALARVQRAMASHLAVAGLPEALAGTLRRMLEPHPQDRISAFEATKHLEQHWQTIRAHWVEEDETPPRLVAFMPDECVKTLYEERQWVPRSPDSPAGQEDLRRFLADELENAELVHSPIGAIGYATGPEDSLRDAQWVLVGRRAVWFCAVLFDIPDPMTRTRTRYREVLVIKYLRESEIATELVGAPQRRRASPLEIFPFSRGQDLSALVKGRPSWEDLQKAVRNRARQDTPSELYLRSLQFLLDYQRTVLNARCYPFKRVGDEAKRLVTVTFDQEADAERRHHMPLLAAYVHPTSGRRAPMGEFFQQADADGDKTLLLDVVRRTGGQPFFGRDRVRAVFEESVDQHTMQVSIEGPGTMPEKGWVRCGDDSGTGPQLERQERALLRLRAQPLLVESLRLPAAFDLGRGRWNVVADQLGLRDRPGRPMTTKSLQTMERMLGTHPLYALQGPPGSGKSTVTAAAVECYLAVEQGARLLVSSQSNYTLDGLAEKLIKSLPRRTLILRETALDKEDEVENQLVRRHTLKYLTEAVKEATRKLLRARLTGRYSEETGRLAEEWSIDLESLPPLQDQQRELAERWLAAVEDNQLELSDRIRNGASIVLATCSIAATVNDGRWDPRDLFDWVIVEEAAKAWSTELIVPLVLGVRWTLIGDHLQLGPHREEDLRAFLSSLRGHPDPLVALEHDRADSHLSVLRLFEHLFDGRGPDTYNTDGSPVGRLEEEFRMDKVIANPVLRAFYPRTPPTTDETGFPVSFLTSEASRPHGVTQPGFLRNRPLVWIDTSGRDGHQDEPRWYNPGEVELIDRLVQRMHPAPAPAGDLDADDSLVVLTPYRAQLEKLQGRNALRGRQYTVHQFQGQEADRVVVSLVRTTAYAESPDHVQRNVGHVAQLELTNVLLSRAKRLMVMVGSLEHFATYGGEHWRAITGMAQRFGTVIPAEEVDE
jgi:hypothetical protein